MRNYFLIALTFISLVFVGVLVLAQELDSLSQITFPVQELGNCQSKEDCETFCDQPENMAACLDFAETHNLISPEELAMARRMLVAGETGGPGGCQGKLQCEQYCDNINNIEECLAFAEKHDLIPADELAEGKKVAAAIKQGIKPPACKNKKECDVYCGRPENMEECLVFAEAAGLIPSEELGEAKKALAAVKKGAKLPACRGKAECDVYCSQDEHFQECLDFAEAAGFILPEEAAMARRTGGKGPGGCRGKEVCDAYCEDPANAEACVDFAVQYGFMPVEEAEQAKKMMKMGIRGGPGGCEGKEACEAYCNDLSHLVECVDFAEKAGFMTSEEAARARRMAERGVNVMQGGPGNCKGKEECEAFCQNPENSQTCLDFAIKIGDISPEEAQRAQQGMKMMQRGGPGGCKSEPECKQYCEDPAHGQECLNFAIENDLIPPEEAQRMQEMMQQQQQTPPLPEGVPQPLPEGMMPEGEIPGGIMRPPTPEEIERMWQEGRERVFEQIEQIIPEGMTPEGALPEQMLPPPPSPESAPMPLEEQPQSFLETAQNFLANTLLLLQKNR